MNELVKTIDELYAAFKTDAELQAGKNNKAAGLRARKVSQIQPRSFPSVVREGFNRSRRLVLRFSTDILWTA